MSNGNWCYDVECYPNVFCCTFVNLDSDEKRIFVIGFRRDDRKELREFLSNEVKLLAGYNSIDYDGPMLRFARDYNGDNVNKKLLELSNKLVSRTADIDNTMFGLRYPKNRDEWKNVDLMKILAANKESDGGRAYVSLKQIAINLKWPHVQDLPYEPNSYIRPEDLETLLAYNLNDVLITKELYKKLEPLHEVRRSLGELYKLDFSSASNSKMGEKILEKYYAQEAGIKVRDIKDRRTERYNVRLGDCLPDYIRFSTPELKSLCERVASKIVYKDSNFAFSDFVEFAGCNFTLGIGGLHSKDGPGIFESDSEYIVQDGDVASYYPNLITNNNFYPEHLGPEFIKVLKAMTEKRLQAKHEGNSVEAAGLKISINSIFGKLKFDKFWLYDPKAFLSTTLTGQLSLLMLIEGWHNYGITILSANTDGIVCKIPRDKLDIYYEVAKKWENITGLSLEYTAYKKYVRSDVNSYITEKEDGTVKEKNRFSEEIDISRGYNMPIVSRALKRYFIDGIPVKDTIYNSRDIFDFCISKKSDKKYEITFETIYGKEFVTKTNRFYVSNLGGALIKNDKTTGKKISMMAKKNVTLLNDFDKDKPFDTYDINYNFYITEVEKIIDEIKPKQLTFGW